VSSFEEEEKMSKLVRILIGAALITASSIGVVNAQMAGTKHDLRTNPGTLPTGQGQDLCRFCHAPHNASATAPLWDRNASDTSGSFILYPAGGTMENTPAQPTGVSNGCLSCHDGVTAFDSLIGVTGTAGNDMNTLYGGSAAILGSDLSNDHPIAVSVVTADEMESIATIELGGVPLFGGSNDQVECASCHDPHLTTYTYFLRLNPASGTLCETCHTK